MASPELYVGYDRRAIHDLFDPDSEFYPQAGTWGLQGIIRDPNSDDVIFLVTYAGASAIHLFLCTTARSGGVITPYTYLGRLKYRSHDPVRERPVHLSWQLLDWPIPSAVLQRMGLRLEQSNEIALPPESADEAPFDPADIQDGREKVLRSIKARRGQKRPRRLARCLRRTLRDFGMRRS